MLASITPLGERSRRSRWGITVSAFALGATAAGAASGALLGLLGSWLLPWASEHLRLGILAVASLVALSLDLFVERVPGPHRQVDERWRQKYRGWVYGIGYGAQLGLGVTTVVRSAATYTALLGAFLTASPGAGALVVGVFGLLRGLQPLGTWRITRPDQLVRFHARFTRWGGGARIAGCVLLATAVALALGGSLT